MKYKLDIKKDGRFWAVDFPELHTAGTQGRTAVEACFMAADWFQTVVDDYEVKVIVDATEQGQIFANIEEWTEDPEPIAEMRRKKDEYLAAMAEAAAQFCAEINEIRKH